VVDELGAKLIEGGAGDLLVGAADDFLFQLSQLLPGMLKLDPVLQPVVVTVKQTTETSPKTQRVMEIRMTSMSFAGEI
jgi:hypothetical protein